MRSLFPAFFTPQELEPLIRVIRSLMSRLADALTAMLRIDISVPMDAAGASDGRDGQCGGEAIVRPRWQANAQGLPRPGRAAIAGLMGRPAS